MGILRDGERDWSWGCGWVLRSDGVGIGMGMEVGMAVPLPQDMGTAAWEGDLQLLEASPEQGWFLVSHLGTHLGTNTALHPGDRAWGLAAAWCCNE